MGVTCKSRQRRMGCAGDEVWQEGLVFFSSLEDRVPDKHPLRTIRSLVEISPLFDRLYTQKGRSPNVNFRGGRRTNDTHTSQTDPDPHPAKIKGKEATDRTEVKAALELLGRKRTSGGCGPMTVGAARGYDTKGFVGEARALSITPHVAQKRRH